MKLQALYIRGAWVLLGLKLQAGNNNDITTITSVLLNQSARMETM